MNIEDLTIKQARELASIFGGGNSPQQSLNGMIGSKVIIRTYSAGVFFGTLSEKSQSEVIINNARRLWRWKTKESVSLSSVAIYGLDEKNSKVAEAVESIWLDAIEIIPCTSGAIKSIEGCDNVKAS